jgi:hypothetical protein
MRLVGYFTFSLSGVHAVGHKTGLTMPFWGSVSYLSLMVRLNPYLCHRAVGWGEQNGFFLRGQDGAKVLGRT